MGRSDKVKAAASLAAVAVAGLFLAAYFGADAGWGGGGADSGQALTPQEADEIERARIEQLRLMNEDGIKPAGA